jgi:hypothetical protein
MYIVLIFIYLYIHLTTFGIPLALWLFGEAEGMCLWCRGGCVTDEKDKDDDSGCVSGWLPGWLARLAA